jgi:hypothetical protein
VKLSNLLIFVMSLSAQMANAHEETCTFKGKLLADIGVSGVRTPQGEGILVPAEIQIIEAQSMNGHLSRLDCKHWIGIRQKIEQLLVPSSSKNNPKKNQLVSIDFLSRIKNGEMLRFWTLSDSKK